MCTVAGWHRFLLLQREEAGVQSGLVSHTMALERSLVFLENSVDLTRAVADIVQSHRNQLLEVNDVLTFRFDILTGY